MHHPFSTHLYRAVPSWAGILSRSARSTRKLPYLPRTVSLVRHQTTRGSRYHPVPLPGNCHEEDMEENGEMADSEEDKDSDEDGDTNEEAEMSEGNGEMG